MVPCVCLAAAVMLVKKVGTSQVLCLVHGNALMFYGHTKSSLIGNVPKRYFLKQSMMGK